MTAKAPHRILIVDDEASIAQTLSLILKNEGYETAVAYDAESALAKTETFAPDIVLADVMLPGMNGVELAILIRQAYPNCSVCIISGHPATADYLRAAEARGHAFPAMAKPFHPTELIQRVSAISSAN